jgi:hypothetical protein
MPTGRLTRAAGATAGHSADSWRTICADSCCRSALGWGPGRRRVGAGLFIDLEPPRTARAVEREHELSNELSRYGFGRRATVLRRPAGGYERLESMRSSRVLQRKLLGRSAPLVRSLKARHHPEPSTPEQAPRMNATTSSCWLSAAARDVSGGAEVRASTTVWSSST